MSQCRRLWRHVEKECEDLVVKMKIVKDKHELYDALCNQRINNKVY